MSEHTCFVKDLPYIKLNLSDIKEFIDIFFSKVKNRQLSLCSITLAKEEETINVYSLIELEAILNSISRFSKPSRIIIACSVMNCKINSPENKYISINISSFNTAYISSDDIEWLNDYKNVLDEFFNKRKCKYVSLLRYQFLTPVISVILILSSLLINSTSISSILLLLGLTLGLVNLISTLIIDLRNNNKIDLSLL